MSENQHAFSQEQLSADQDFVRAVYPEACLHRNIGSGVSIFTRLSPLIPYSETLLASCDKHARSFLNEQEAWSMAAARVREQS